MMNPTEVRMLYDRHSPRVVEHMEKTGKIEKTGDYNIYKIGKSVTAKEDEY
jgi:hypothetical protein